MPYESILTAMPAYGRATTFLAAEFVRPQVRLSLDEFLLFLVSFTSKTIRLWWASR
jgi:hypothetical protein